MIPLMSDSRVAFLVYFISAAIFLAVILIFIEIGVRKKRAREAEIRRLRTPIDNMRVFLAGEASPREKLDVIGKTAKDYFKREYGISERMDYGELSKTFKEKGGETEALFCDEMFEAYYSNHSFGQEKIEELAGMLIQISSKKNPLITVNVSSSGNKVGAFIEGAKGAVVEKIDSKVKARDEKIEREARTKERDEYELMSWVRRAIRMGYDEEKLLGLLDDGSRSKKDVKRVLSIYEDEVKKIEKEEGPVPTYYAEGGIAQRIIQKEKDRLGEASARQDN